MPQILQHEGPWTYRKGPVDFHIDSADPVLSIAVACDEDTARAIAALPDLLAALIAVRASPLIQPAVMDLVCAALAKANA